MTRVYQRRDELAYMSKAESDERITDIVLEKHHVEYDMVKINAERDPDFALQEIEVTMRNMYANNRVAPGEFHREGRGVSPS